MLTEQRFDCGGSRLLVPPARQRHRKVVGHGPARPQLGKFVLEVTMLNLMERHRSDVTQVVGADRPHRDASGRLPACRTTSPLTTICPPWAARMIRAA